MPPGTTFRSRRPPLIRSNAAATCANSPVAMNPGRTATRNRMRELTAASAVAVVQVSARGAVSSKSPLAKRVGISREE